MTNRGRLKDKTIQLLHELKDADSMSKWLRVVRERTTCQPAIENAVNSPQGDMCLGEVMRHARLKGKES